MNQQLQRIHTPGPEVAQSVDVDGIWDERRQVLYMGTATKQPSGRWHCLAQVGGALCVIEVTIVIGVTSNIVFRKRR